MRIQSYRRLGAESTIDAPPYIQNIVGSQNDTFELLTTAMQNNLTFADNMNASVIDIPLEHDTATEISTRSVKGQVKHAICSSTDAFDYFKFKWQVVDTNTIRVAVKWDTDPGQATNCRLVLFGV